VLHKNYNLTGNFKNTGFVFNTLIVAEQLAVKGFVKLQSPTNIYIEAEGSKEALEKFSKWCRLGTSECKVKEVKETDGEFQNYPVFQNGEHPMPKPKEENVYESKLRMKSKEGDD
jgi:acylphosphatase